MVNLDDIRAAAVRLKPIVVRTPLISSPTLDELVGGKVFLKAENLQRVGSFKIRGAYNMLSQLTPEQAARGVIACCSRDDARYRNNNSDAGRCTENQDREHTQTWRQDRIV
jgi:threonine dehydratase